MAKESCLDSQAEKTFSAAEHGKWVEKKIRQEPEKPNDGIYVICHLTPHLHLSAYLGN